MFGPIWAMVTRPVQGPYTEGGSRGGRRREERRGGEMGVKEQKVSFREP